MQTRQYHLTINLYETGALRACANSCALALTLALRVRIVLIASLILFLDLCFGFLSDPFAKSRFAKPAFLGTQRLFGVYGGVGFASGSYVFGVSESSSPNAGNLSTGLVKNCVFGALVGICNSVGCNEERRPVPVVIAVVISQSLSRCWHGASCG